MAAINKNFVIKHGIEVGDNLIFGNKEELKVGIGTTNPAFTLDVRGGIGATSVSVGQTITANSGVVTNFTAENLTIDGGTFTAGGSSGTNGQYLKSTATGVEWATFPTSKTSDFQTATASQTTFTSTYYVGLVDVYINGVKLANTEFTATDGTNIVLSNPCFGGEIVEIVAFGTVTTGVGGTGIQGLTVKSEGTIVGTTAGVTSIDFVGAAFSVTGPGAGLTITLSQEANWQTTYNGLYNTGNVGVGTTSTEYPLTVGTPGVGGTALFVNGDARITGILTIGTASIKIDGSSNTITVGSGVTINGSTGEIIASSVTLDTGALGDYANVAGVSTNAQGLTGTPDIIVGIVTASSTIVGSAVTIDSSGINVSGAVTATSFVKAGGTSSQFLKADGTIDSSTYLTSYTETDTIDSVLGRGSSTTKGISVGVLTATSLSFSGVLNSSGANISGVTTLSTLNVGTGGTIITTTSDGLIGIGTTNPSATLMIVGSAGATKDARIVLRDTSSDAPEGTVTSVDFQDSTGTLKGYVGDRYSDKDTIQLSSAGGLSLESNNEERVTILSTGEVGIGTTIPVSGSSLQVGTGVTIYGNLGIVSATAYYGDGSNLDGVSGLSGRTTSTVTTASIGTGATTDVTITGYKTYSLLKIGVTEASWVVLYTDTDSRVSDAAGESGGRDQYTDPTPGSGVIAEVITGAGGTVLMSPAVIGWNNDGTTNVYGRVVNLSGSSVAIGITLTMVKMEN